MTIPFLDPIDMVDQLDEARDLCTAINMACDGIGDIDKCSAIRRIAGLIHDRLTFVSENLQGVLEKGQ